MQGMSGLLFLDLFKERFLFAVGNGGNFYPKTGPAFLPTFALFRFGNFASVPLRFLLPVPQ